MTTRPGLTVTDPFAGRPHDAPTHEKAQALGWQLASRIVPILRQPAPATNRAPISVRAPTLEIPLNNWAFLYGEINSLGPECAPTLHAAFQALAAKCRR